MHLLLNLNSRIYLLSLCDFIEMVTGNVLVNQISEKKIPKFVAFVNFADVNIPKGSQIS